MAACAMLLRQADTPSPKKGAFYKREAGLGAAQGQSLVRAAQSPGFHPKLHRKRGGGQEKTCYNEGSNTVANAWVALGETHSR